MTPSQLQKLTDRLISSANQEIDKNNFKSAYFFLSSTAGLCRRFPFCFTHEGLEESLQRSTKKFFENQKFPPGEKKVITWVIATSIRSTGGHSRYALNLIRNLSDIEMNKQTAESNQPTAIHLILTNQIAPIPEMMKHFNQGQIHNLNNDTKDPIEKIMILRELIEKNTTHHIYYLIDPDDVLTILSLQSHNYSSTYINHSDETFWAGNKLAKQYAEMRYEGLYISKHFRKIDKASSVIFPIPIEENKISLVPPAPENHPVLEKIRNIPKSAFVCLSVNPVYKLTPYKQYDFYETLERILEIAPHVWLIAVGHGIPEKLKLVSLRFMERVILWNSYPYDLSPLFSRANLLLDGFQLGSTTVLLEYLRFKKPFLTLAIPQADVLGSQDPRLSCPEFEVSNRISYLQKVQSMVEYYPEHKKMAEEYYDRFLRFKNLDYKPVLKFDSDFTMSDELILEILRHTH